VSATTNWRDTTGIDKAISSILPETTIVLFIVFVEASCSYYIDCLTMFSKSFTLDFRAKNSNEQQ
jgi:hypothetical protein